MKSKVLLFMVGAWICSIGALSAQSVQTATLQKSDGVQVFYGMDALNDAVITAQDGNVIYLSAGDFNGLSNVQKSIKIIGSGGFNAIEAKNTVIRGLQTWRNGSYTDYLEFEGFVVKGTTTLYQSSMVKMEKISFEGDCNLQDVNNIEISSSLVLQYFRFSYNSCINTVIANCIINCLANGPVLGSTVLVSNSIIYALDYAEAVRAISLKNNIIVANQYGDIPASVNNNVFTGAGNFPDITNQSGNWENVVLSDLFVNQPENKWDPTYDYHLKNPANYTRPNDTQAGIYGGVFPWNPVPSNPQILESKVEPVTTNDGKLNFQIKAEAQQ